jgi:hypothetical protein
MPRELMVEMRLEESMFGGLVIDVLPWISKPEPMVCYLMGKGRCIRIRQERRKIGRYCNRELRQVK